MKMRPALKPFRVSLVLALLLAASGCRQVSKKTGPSFRVVQAMNKGVSFMGQYQYNMAVEAFQEALQADPDLVDAKINLAISRFNRNRKEDQDETNATRLLNEVIGQDPENERALYCKGIILQHLGQADQAIACFQKVVQKRPQDGAAWYLLGLCKLRVGQSATNELLRSVQLKPYLYSAYYQLFQIAQRERNLEKAKQYGDLFKKLRESPLGETIELPQYNQMGDLALVQPLFAQGRTSLTKSRFRAGASKQVYRHPKPLIRRLPDPTRTTRSFPEFGGLAAGDINGDGNLDFILTSGEADSPENLILLLGEPDGGFSDATADAGLNTAQGALSCALGDYDNDEKTDLFVACAAQNHLFKGAGDGTFQDVTETTGTGGGAVVSLFAMFLDADHDADLDILVCNAGPLAGGGTAPNQLWNNNADGTFTDIARQAGIECGNSICVSAQAGDIDGDRDIDLLILRRDEPAKLYLNHLLGHFRETEIAALEIQGAQGAVLQDFTGDGELDILALGAQGPSLFLGDGDGQFKPSDLFRDYAKAASSRGPVRAMRAGDIDLDGDLDIALFSEEGHLLLNDGTGKFVFRPEVWPASESQQLIGAELFDLNNDYVPDLIRIEHGESGQVSICEGELSPPPTGLTLLPRGLRGSDKRTRSPANGFGVRVTTRAKLRQQTFTYTGLWGGFNQSTVPMNFGLDGASQADYVTLLWPDGVQQVEIGLAAGQDHTVPETQRKISSCPVLFTWNGRRFEFVADFAGVGGLGYFSAPGESAPPQVLEHVKIESTQLQPRNGFYELRICEPMEEIAYIDRLELLALDHPTNQSVFPDERLAVSGPPPTHQLLVADSPLFPVKAQAPDGADCTERLARVDRRYAYQPPLDRRFIGFCKPHTLELDFADGLIDIRSTDQIFMFIRGYIEYPYSQTVYAAAQAKMGWEPIRIERLTQDGVWKTLIPDAGVPGGMDRTMTIDLTSQLTGPSCRLRVTTNMEVYYDQIFLARNSGLKDVAVHNVPLGDAQLRRAGFAREYSPDGRLPLIYDYHLMDPSAPFHVLSGAYTRYGPVGELLQSFDDRFVLVGPGDEIALRFKAESLSPVASGKTRSFVLISHAYCKDMDLYTATPETVEPLPFAEMSRYPYPSTEHYPNDAAHQDYKAEYNTRVIH